MNTILDELEGMGLVWEQVHEKKGEEPSERTVSDKSRDVTSSQGMQGTCLFCCQPITFHS